MDIEGFTNNTNKSDLLNIYRTLHSTTADTIFPAQKEHFYIYNAIKTIFNKLWRTEFIQHDM